MRRARFFLIIVAVLVQIGGVAVGPAAAGAPLLMWQYGGCTSGPSCQTGWYSSPAVADLDRDGQPDVIWGAYDVVALNGATGSLTWRGPSANRVWPGVAVADLTGDGTLEVVVGRSADELTVYSAAGAVVWTRNPFGSGELRTLAVSDLENDSQLEIVAGHAGSSTYQLNVFEPTGTGRAGWPARRAGEPGYGIGLFNQNVAIADMNGDGGKELFAPTSGHYISAFDRNGNQLPVNGVFAPRQVWSEVGVHLDHEVDLRGWANCGVEHRPNFQDSSPAVADVDGDGMPELIVVGNVQNCGTHPATSLYHIPYIFKLDRMRWSGIGFDWTVLPAPSPGSAPRSVDWNVIETAVPNAVVADLDGDGFKEIIYPSYDGRVHAFWLDKTEHGSWPYTVPASGGVGDEFRFAGEPIVVDLDNDGRAEVIFTSWPKKASGGVGQLHILNYLGVELYRVDLPAPDLGHSWNGGLGAPTIANIDGDADLELVVGTVASGVVAYKLPNTANARVLWGTGRGNYGRTGVAPTVAAPPPPDGTPPTVTITSPASGATVSGTITVSASASDNVGVAGVQFFVDGVAIGTEDTTSPYSVAWDTTTVADGSHTLTARARDAAGNTATSAGVTVTVANGTAGTNPVTWTSLVNVTASANSLQKTSGCDGCADAGAVSVETISSAGGFMEFTASETTTMRVVGLSNGNTDTSAVDIDFGLKFWSGGGVSVEENGLYRADTTFVTGDVFRIAVTSSGTVTYAKNGVVFYTSTKAAIFPLLVDTTIYTLNGTIQNVGMQVPSADTTPPTVAITSPASGATVSGTVTVSASASDNVGVAGVQFFVDGVALGTEDTTAPYSVAWDTTTVADGSHTLTARARDAAGNTATSAGVTVTVSNAPADTTPPTVAITSPTSGATVSGTITVSASASDNVGVTAVDFRVDGTLIGTDTTSPYSISWDTTTTTNGSHTLTAVARDAAGNSATSSAVTVTVANADTTPPTVSITSPTSGATVSGTITVTASASDNVGVAGVQFFVDGAAIGTEDTTSPYSVAWDTTTVADGSHTLTARARDAAGNTATSAGVTVTVSNAPTGGTTRFEESAAILAPSNVWFEVTSGSTGVTLSGGTAQASRVAGGTATFGFTGTGVSWIGFPCERCGIARVFVDGTLVATVDTYAPTRPAASVAMFTASGLAAGSHTLVVEVTGTANPSSLDMHVVVDAFDVTSDGAPPPADTTPPTVSITSPTSGATVSGAITVTASASDNVGVAGVQFFVDGVALGVEDTTAPYSVAWDTTTVADGSHTLTARARDAAGNTATSAGVTVTVSNAAAPPAGTTRFEESAATLVPPEAWFGVTSADTGVNLSGDNAVAAAPGGATATFTFTGTGVSWIGFPCEACGIARVFVDGALVATVDTFAPTRPAASVSMFSTSGLAAGSHTLVIEVTGTKNPSSGNTFIVVDAFDVTP